MPPERGSLDIVSSRSRCLPQFDIKADAPSKTLSLAPKMHILDTLDFARTRPVDPFIILASQTLTPGQIVVHLYEVVVPQHWFLWLEPSKHMKHSFL